MSWVEIELGKTIQSEQIRILGGFGSHYFFTGIVYNSRRSRQLEKLYWSRTGGSIHRTIYNIFCEKWVFSLKMYKFVREIWVAADSQRRRNNILFPRSEAEGKYGLFRSQQRRLRLVAVAATRQQQCNLPSLQPAASHLDWPAERKHVGFLSARGDFAVSDWNRKMWRSGELGRGVGFIRSAWVEGGRTNSN